MKVCNKRKQTKSLDDFHKSSNKHYKDGLQGKCKACMHEYHQTWYKANKDTEKAKCRAWAQFNREICTTYVKNWQKRNPNSVKNSHLKSDHSITLDLYNQLLTKQHNSCAICRRHESQSRVKLAVDHCHETGTIRGLLCDRCNRGIGYLQDKIEILEAAISYLKILRNE